MIRETCRIWRILAYFILYSILGYLIETIFGIVTEGIWESRQSFLYGPFCGIYGIGAVVMILSLQYFKQNKCKIFIGGFLVGSITEYIISWYGDIFLNIKWWDYANMPLNINGRICVLYSIFWGLLAIVLISYVNPKVDKIIDWIKSKIVVKKLKIITTIVSILLLMDCIVTGYALKFFWVRKVYQNNIQVLNQQQINKEYDKIYGNQQLANFIYKFWGDRTMITTFPNLKTQDKNGNIIYFDCYVDDIQPYYYKFY